LPKHFHSEKPDKGFSQSGPSVAFGQVGQGADLSEGIVVQVMDEKGMWGRKA